MESKFIKFVLDIILIVFAISFRKKWLINYYGKWADQQYSSTIYPQFACGSGYILTRDLVDFLILNRKQLRRYQGEDISMGIWLAAIDPKRIQVFSKFVSFYLL